MPHSENSPRELVIDANGPRLARLLRELREHHELLGFLVWRDVTVRYKQTVLGVLWVAARPVLAMLVFLAVFHRIAGIRTGDVPYPLFAFTGTMLWMLFSDGVSGSVQNMLSGSHLITKVYFPRVLIPAAAVLRGVVDFSIGSLLLAVMLLFFGYPFTWTWLLLPVLALWTCFLSLGIALWATALAVRFRDVAHGLGFMLQLLFWVSPVGYGLSALPPHLRTLYALNPLVGLLEAARSWLLGLPLSSHPSVALSVILTLVLVLSGLAIFHRMERDFADLV